jgi:ankyrin repeat protein
MNAKNNEGQTPLMMAIKLKNKTAIELLRKHGAK